MDIVAATDSLSETHAQDIPEFVWATGPVSYEYQFGDRALFDAVVLESWRRQGTLFAADATSLAVEDGALLGIEIGMRGSEFRPRQHALAPVWRELMEERRIDRADLHGVLERAGHASWLNPVIDADTYYIHAISVRPEHRGKRVGYHLMENAITSARAQGFARFQLDVLSDNPAVEFYRSVGLEVLAETRAPEPSAFGIPPEYRMGMALA